MVFDCPHNFIRCRWCSWLSEIGEILHLVPAEQLQDLTTWKSKKAEFNRICINMYICVCVCMLESWLWIRSKPGVETGKNNATARAWVGHIMFPHTNHRSAIHAGKADAWTILRTESLSAGAFWKADLKVQPHNPTWQQHILVYFFVLQALSSICFIYCATWQFSADLWCLAACHPSTKGKAANKTSWDHVKLQFPEAPPNYRMGRLCSNGDVLRRRNSCSLSNQPRQKSFGLNVQQQTQQMANSSCAVRFSDDSTAVYMYLYDSFWPCVIFLCKFHGLVM